MAFKQVNAVHRCFHILDLLARHNAPMGISEIASATGLNKSTVYNLLHSLVELTVLHKADDKFFFGPKFFLLGQAIDYESLLSRRIRPRLEAFSEQTRLTTSLGIRSGSKLIVLDRIVMPGGIDVVNKSRSRPLLDGVHGLAVLSLLPDDEVQAFLEREEPIKFTRKTVTGKRRLLGRIQDIRDSGLAIEREEYHPGIWAVAAAFWVSNLGTQAVVWTFGLESRVDDGAVRAYAVALRDLVARIKSDFEVGRMA